MCLSAFNTSLESIVGIRFHLSLHSLGAEEGADLRLGHIDPGHDRPVIWTTLQVRGTGEDILPGARGRRLGVALPFVAQCDAGGS